MGIYKYRLRKRFHWILSQLQKCHWNFRWWRWRQNPNQNPWHGEVVATIELARTRTNHNWEQGKETNAERCHFKKHNKTNSILKWFIVCHYPHTFLPSVVLHGCLQEANRLTPGTVDNCAFRLDQCETTRKHNFLFGDAEASYVL